MTSDDERMLEHGRQFMDDNPELFRRLAESERRDNADGTTARNVRRARYRYLRQLAYSPLLWARARARRLAWRLARW